MDEPCSPEYTIGEVAKKLGIVVPLIRMLEKAGLVLSARTEHGKRLYSQCDVDYIQAVIKVARSKDYSLEDMNQCIGAIKCWEVINCPVEVREKCPQYINSNKPCWVGRDCPVLEREETCRECPVYLTISESLLEQL